jgi:hypothetical protein
MLIRDWVTTTLVIVVLLLVIGFIMGLTPLLVPDTSPEISQTIILVIGLGGLVALLVISVTIFRATQLLNKDSAFGLPEGTIRAIIAIGLILIFAMVSVFIYYQVKNPPTSREIVMTEEQYQQVPVESIIFAKPDKDNSELFTVILAQPRNQNSDDIAKQLLTTIGTLAVAVAGFYFGTQTKSSQRQEVSSASPEITDFSPKGGKQGQPINLEIVGKNLTQPKAVKFTLGDTEMDLEDIKAFNTKIKGKLKIDVNQLPGKYILTVQNDDDTVLTINDTFEVKTK